MTQHSYSDTAIVLSFPDNWAKGEKLRDRLLHKLNITYTQYYKVGHAALLLIDRASGSIEYFDYGRYISPPKHGRVRSALTDPKLEIPLKASFDQKGKITNLFAIMNYLDSMAQATHGHGATYFSICPNINFKRGIEYTERQINRGSIPYVTFGLGGMNCSSFVARTLLRALPPGGKKKQISFSLLFAPTPMTNVFNTSDEGAIWKFHDGHLESLKLNRAQLFKVNWQGLSQSLKKNKHLLDTINTFNRPPIGPFQIPQQAQLLSSLGESCWMHIVREPDAAENEYIVESYSEHHTLNYSIKAEINRDSFNLNAPYTFTYLCNKLITTLIQDGVVYTLHFKQYTKQHIHYFSSNK